MAQNHGPQRVFCDDQFVEVPTEYDPLQDNDEAAAAIVFLLNSTFPRPSQTGGQPMDMALMLPMMTLLANLPGKPSVGMRSHAINEAAIVYAQAPGDPPHPVSPEQQLLNENIPKYITLKYYSSNGNDDDAHDRTVAKKLQYHQTAEHGVLVCTTFEPPTPGGAHYDY